MNEKDSFSTCGKKYFREAKSPGGKLRGVRPGFGMRLEAGPTIIGHGIRETF
jgi:hypothetical protein